MGDGHNQQACEQRTDAIGENHDAVAAIMRPFTSEVMVVMNYVRMVTVGLLAVLALAPACTSKNPNACNSDSDCKNPSDPFCDVKGEYPESHYTAHECSIVPANCPVDRCGCTAGASLACANDQVTLCGSDGRSTTMEACPLGCSAAGSDCATFTPSNNLGDALADAASQPDVLFPPMAHIDTELGIVQDGSGNAVNVKTTLVNLDGGLSMIRVLEGKSFVIDDVTVTGAYAVAFVAPGAITIRGKVDAGARAATPGPGGQTSAAACIGADAVLVPQGCSICSGAVGAGGGGNATAGARGGFVGSPGGAILTNFAPLLGGCHGGNFQGNLGGGGGGAVQIVSLTSVLLTDHGLVTVAGGGGASTAGGGSAGVVVIEAPTVRFEGPMAGLAANGGAGGGCSMTGPDGTSDGTAAIGPQCSPNSAGAGGTGFANPSNGQDCNGTCATTFEGGGGGAAGRVRIATRTGDYDMVSGPILSAAITKDTLQVQ